MMDFRLTLALLAPCAAITLEAASRTTFQDRSLFFPAAELSTEAPTANGFVVTGVSASSTHGGRISLVNTQAWVRHFSGPANYNHALSLAIDPSGNLLVEGQSEGPGSGFDFATVKYAPDGTALWTNRYDSGDGDEFWSQVITDESGNAYVTGATPYDAVLIQYGPGGTAIRTNRYNATGTNVAYPFGIADRAGNLYLSTDRFGPNALQLATIKYDPFGTPVWTNHGSAGFVVVDGSGNVFVGNYGAFKVTKIASDGRSLWTNEFHYGVVSHVTVMTLDRVGNVIVSGESLGGPTTTYTTLKYSGDGLPIWTNLMAGPMYSGGNFPQILTDLNNNAFIIGGSREALGEDVDTTILKLTPGGVPIWTNRLVDVNTGNGATGASAVDAAGHLYVLANSNGGEIGNFDILIAKYAPGGTALWTNRYEGIDGRDDFVNAAVVDRLGNLYFAGRSSTLASGNVSLTIKHSDYVFYTPPTNFIGQDAFSFSAVDGSGASITGTVNVTVSPLTLNLAALSHTAAGFRFQAFTTNSAAPVVIQASSDLIHWQPVFTNASPAGQIEFLDPAAKNIARRFYRAVQGPPFSIAAGKL